MFPPHKGKQEALFDAPPFEKVDLTVARTVKRVHASASADGILNRLPVFPKAPSASDELPNDEPVEVLLVVSEASSKAQKASEAGMKAISQRENGGASVRDSASDYGFKQSGSWTFHDKNVADNFDNEVHGHVAGYGVVIRLCAELSLRIHGPQKRVLSYWCGIGNQFEQYLKRGWSPEMIEGMNYSAPLRDRCVERFPEIRCHLGVDKEGAWNPLEAGGPGYYATIQMLWALHFEGAAEKRLALLHKCYEALEPGGLMLLADKTRQPDVLEGLYHDYKRSQGVPEGVIQIKKTAIQGVLVPFPTSWYEEALSGVGFVEIAIVHATCGFVTWMARKPHAPPSTVEDGMCAAPSHADSVLFLHGHRPSGLSSDVKHLFRRPEQGKYHLDGLTESRAFDHRRS